MTHLVRIKLLALLYLGCVVLSPRHAAALGEGVLPPGNLPVGPFVAPNYRAPRSGEYLITLTPKGEKRVAAKARKRPGVTQASKRAFRTELAKSFGLRISELLFNAAFLVKGQDASTLKTSRAIRDGLVARVELNYPLYAFGISPRAVNEPNDFMYTLGFLWGLNNTNNMDVDALDAWEISEGDPNIVVGVIDTGISLKHPDLSANLWVNANEIPNNGRDDDRNGLVDDVNGYDFIGNDSNPDDDMFHGTHVAGVIGAACHNQRGICGVAPRVKLMSLKILDARGAGDMAGLLKAIRYAIEMKRRGVNIRVLNASLGGAEKVESFQDLLEEANRAGIVFIAAAGNETNNNDEKATYPANYPNRNVVSVAALDKAGKLASFSNFGRAQVDVGAPGVGIWSSFPFGFYLPFDGTSMAAPYVAGVAALVASVHPEFSAAQIADRVKDSVKPISSLEGTMAYPGMVSAYRAISY